MSNSGKLAVNNSCARYTLESTTKTSGIHSVKLRDPPSYNDSTRLQKLLSIHIRTKRIDDKVGDRSNLSRLIVD